MWRNHYEEHGDRREPTTPYVVAVRPAVKGRMQPFPVDYVFDNDDEHNQWNTVDASLTLRLQPHLVITAVSDGEHEGGDIPA